MGVVAVMGYNLMINAVMGYNLRLQAKCFATRVWVDAVTAVPKTQGDWPGSGPCLKTQREHAGLVHAPGGLAVSPVL